MTFELVYSKKAQKQFESLNPQTAVRLLDGCERLKHNPFSEGKHVKKLRGYEGLYRLRIGDFRIVFRISKNHVEVVDVISKPDFQKSY